MTFDINKFKKQNAPSQAAERLQRAKDAVGQDSGSSWASILDVSKAPYAVKWWKPTAGTHYLDIIGYEVTNRQNPGVRNGQVSIGDYDFGMSIWTHPDPKGGGGKPHVCLKRNNYSQNCPRCDEFFRKKEDGGTYVKGVKGSGNSLHRSSERTFLIVVPRENRNTPGTEVFIWETSVFSFTAELLAEANDTSNGKAPTLFWYPTDEGRTVEFTAVPGSMDNSFDFKRFKFHPRPESIGSKLYEKFSFSLDSLLTIPTAQQIEADMYGAPSDEQDTQEQGFGRQTRQDEYHREERDTPDTQQDRQTQKPPVPGTDKLPVDDGNWKAQGSHAPETTGNECPHAAKGYVFGKTSVDDYPAECSACPLFKSCTDAYK